MKENLALDKYKDNVFPGALLIGLNCGPKADISKEHNDGQLVPPPPMSRPFSNDSLFKDVPTETTPQPPDPAMALQENVEEVPAGGALEPETSSRKPRSTPTKANVTIQVSECGDVYIDLNWMHFVYCA